MRDAVSSDRGTDIFRAGKQIRTNRIGQGKVQEVPDSYSFSELHSAIIALSLRFKIRLSLAAYSLHQVKKLE